MFAAPWQLSALDQARAIVGGEVSSRQLTISVLERIGQIDPIINAFTVIDPSAIDQAERADADLRRSGPRSALHGVPISIKDVILTRGLRTTFGSRLYAEFQPLEDDVVVERCRRAGLVILGKTNTPEFGYGAVTDNAVAGTTCNPWSLDRTPGGSSGGAASAVAAGMGAVAIGSDGGGSLRIPASLCGVFTIKPSFGLVPLFPGCRVPSLPGASSWEPLECLGPMSRTVADSAALLSIMAGFDRRDRHSVPAPPADYLKAIDRKLGRCRIAWSPTLGYGRVDAEVRQVAEDAAADLAAALDAELVEIDPPIFDARRDYLALVAASTDLKALRSIARTSRSDLSQGLLETLDHHWRAEDFSNAAMARQDLYDRLRAFMETFRFLVTPTVSVTAFPLGSRSPARIAGLPVRSHREWTPFTFPMSLADLPAASIPAGFDAAGLPVGLQIVGRRFDEAGVLAASAALERVRPWAHSWPAV